MEIDWAALGTVLLVSIGSVAAVTSLFSFGVRAMADRELAREHGATGAGNLAVAVVCYAICALVVLYGIYLLVS